MRFASKGLYIRVLMLGCCAVGGASDDNFLVIEMNEDVHVCRKNMKNNVNISNKKRNRLLKRLRHCQREQEQLEADTDGMKLNSSNWLFINSGTPLFTPLEGQANVV